jgi:amino acid transporter
VAHGTGFERGIGLRSAVAINMTQMCGIGPFVTFVWTAMFTIPLIMATGVIGLVQYLGYLMPGMSWLEIYAISLAVVAIVLFSLYRRVSETGVIGTVLWVVALLSLLIVIVASLTNFHPHLAFTYPHNAFVFGGPFWGGRRDCRAATGAAAASQRRDGGCSRRCRPRLSPAPAFRAARCPRNQ